MYMNIKKVGNLLDESVLKQGFIAESDLPKIKARKVHYVGSGFYSLDSNDNIYQFGIFPTYSRIKLI